MERIEWVAGPDKEGKYIFFLYWPSQHDPTRERGQIFRANPKSYGYEPPTDKREVQRLKDAIQRY